MKVTSYYSVFAAADLDEALKTLKKKYNCKIEHHLKAPCGEDGTFDYYVVSDASDNRTDYFNCTGLDLKDGFFGMRVNVDKLDKAIADLEAEGYKKILSPAGESSMEYVIMMGDEAKGQLNYILFHHNRNYDSVASFMLWSF